MVRSSILVSIAVVFLAGASGCYCEEHFEGESPLVPGAYTYDFPGCEINGGALPDDDYAYLELTVYTSGMPDDFVGLFDWTDWTDFCIGQEYSHTEYSDIFDAIVTVKTLVVDVRVDGDTLTVVYDGYSTVMDTWITSTLRYTQNPDGSIEEEMVGLGITVTCTLSPN